MRRRSRIVVLVAGLAAAASLIAVSVAWPGLDSRTTPPESSSVWALQTGAGRHYARVNTAIGELDTVRSVANPSAVAQTAGGAYLFSQSYGKLTRIDEAMPADLDDQTLRESPSTPAGTVSAVVAGDFVAYRTDSGAVFAGTLDGGAPVQLNPDDAQPDAPQFSAQAIALDDAGTVFAYSAAAGAVVRYRITDGRVLGRDRVQGGPTSPRVGLTAVRDVWFLVDEDTGRLWSSAHDATRALPLVGTLAYGAALSGGDAAWIADDTGLIKLPADGSAPGRVTGGTDADLGTPARPVVDGGVVYAAWLGRDAGTLWRSDTGSHDLPFGTAGLGDDRRPVFAGTGAGLILNETRSGWVWNAHTAALLPSSQDWTLEDRTAPQTAASDEVAPVVIDPKPPVAEPDAFGVRAGGLAGLPVLLNDHDPNADVLSIDPGSVGGLDPAFGTVSVTDSGQRLAVHVAADAQGSATLHYRVTDGTAADGLYSIPTTVTLTVTPPGVNHPPVWCGVDRCLATWPAPQVAPGGTVTIPVLDGWVDPDGDPLMLLSAVDTSGIGAVASTPSGAVVYQHPDASITQPQIAQLQVTVGDTAGAVTTRSLSVRITPAPKLTATSFTVVETVGGGLTVDVGPHVTGTQGRLALSSVRVLDEAGAEAVAGSGGTTFDFSTSTPGVYRVAFTVTDGSSDASATARITVLPKDAPAQLATAGVVAFVHPQQDVTLDVFAAVDNPTRRVLLLSDVAPHPTAGASMSVDVVGQNYLRISGSTASGAAGRLGTIDYTVSDGTDDAGARVRGQATVYLLPPAEDLAPIAVDDTVVVRAGAQVDIPVLDNDVSTSGGAITLNPASVRSSSRAALAFGSGRVLRYLAPTQPGDYRVEYSVYAAGAPSLADTAVVRITVISDESNRPPRPRNLTGRVLTGQTTDIPFRSFGVDPDGDDVALDRILTQPASGSATISADGESIVYTSVPGFHGQVSFSYRVADAFGATGTGTVRVGVLDEQANPSPVTFTDYVQLRVGVGNSVRVSPLANDVDPTGGRLTLTAVQPDTVATLPDGTANPEYTRLSGLVGAVGGGQVEIRAGTAPGTMSFLYDVTSSTGNTARGLIVVKVVREAVPDYPVIADTVLTAQTRERFPDGVDVVAGKVAWTGGDVADLTLTLWGAPAGVSVSGTRLSGPLPERTRIIPFALTGTGASGQSVTSYGFLRIPGEHDITLALRAPVTPQQVTEKQSVTWDMADIVSMPSAATLEVGAPISASGARAHADCARAEGTRVRYAAGEGAPWTDACVVPVRLAGQAEWTYLSVPITITALDPVPVLQSASITVGPGASVDYDLKTMTTWQGRADWDHLVYTMTYQGRDFTVTKKGDLLTVTGTDAATVGADDVAVIGVSSHPGVAPARLILRVGPAPSALPRAGTVAQSCSQASGSSCTIGVIGASGEINPLPGTPLRLVSVQPAGACTGVTFTVADAAQVRAAWAADAPGQTCTAVYSVQDAQGRQTAGARDGQVLLDLQGYPHAPAALVQSGYGDGQITLRVDPGDARGAYPALSGFIVRYQGAVVARCAPDGTCPAIAAPNGQQRRYEAVAVNAVGESHTAAATLAWAYDAPPQPGQVTAAPQVTSGEGGIVSVRVDGIDPEQTAGVRVTSEVGDTVDVPVRRGATSVTVDSYRIGTNSPSSLTVTPYSRFALPPGFDGSTSGQARTISANGIGAPLNPALSVTQASNGDGTATVTVTGRADLGGYGSLLRLGLARDGDRCRPSDVGTATSITQTFTETAGQTVQYQLCAQSWLDGEVFGSASATQTVLVQLGSSRLAPTGYTFRVGASPLVAGDRLEWRIQQQPTSTTDDPPAGATVQMSGYPSPVFDRDPGTDSQTPLEVWYQWGPFQGTHAPVTAASDSAPYQVWARAVVNVCTGGSPLGVVAQFSGNGATRPPTSHVTYYDASGKELPAPDANVPVGTVRVTGTAQLAWGKWGLDAGTQSFDFDQCDPNLPPESTPTPTPTSTPAAPGN
ncbi:Ig-like domain-containing protein [Microbacterium kribbense]|uniref:Ig-like domain-containing protein n=1 Tax=Microbacterium kribbense TaxID=433645 RepID=A0ABP7GSC9_9MICO